MRLFDGSAEYVPADEVTPGQKIREAGEFVEVLDVRREGGKIVVVLVDGSGFEAAPTERILCKIEGGA